MTSAVHFARRLRNARASTKAGEMNSPSHNEMALLIAALARADAAADRKTQRCKEMSADGLARAKAAFMPIEEFLVRLDAALRKSIGSVSFRPKESSEGWIGAGREMYIREYVLRSRHHTSFTVRADFQTLEFEGRRFGIDDITTIEAAIKGWVVSKLQV